MTSPSPLSFAFATAAEVVDAMRVGWVSSMELVEEAIGRVERYDGELNAMCVRDFDQARKAAREADASRARGDDLPILGVPITVKESFNIAGLPTTWGIPSFRDFTAAEDAVAVSRMKAAGAVVIGKTNVPLGLGDLQSYNDLYGATNNPWDGARTAGGSSGGSAAALAAGYGPLSIGSDIAGSLRVPAHFCGVYAHKPSFGLVPTRGHVAPPAPPLDYERDLTVVGPMARSAADLAQMLRILADPGAGALEGRSLASRPARHNRIGDYRVLVLDTHPLIPTSSVVRELIGAVADRVSVAGARVEWESNLLPDLGESARLYMRLLLSVVAASYPPEVLQRLHATAAALDPDDFSLAAERTRGAVLSHRDWLAADGLRTVHREQWRKIFSSFDVVLCPAAPTPAFPHDHSSAVWERSITIDNGIHDYADQLVWAGLATTPGLPATVAPVGESASGLPVGIQIIGPMFEDLTPIRFAELLEREIGGFVPPPLA